MPFAALPCDPLVGSARCGICGQPLAKQGDPAKLWGQDQAASRQPNGEVIDLSASPGGRVFTMVIGFLGVANIFYMTSKMTAFIVESDLNEGLRRHRMQREIGCEARDRSLGQPVSNKRDR